MCPARCFDEVGNASLLALALTRFSTTFQYWMSTGGEGQDLMLDPKTIEKTGSFECVVLIVDINASERLLAVDEWGGTAQFFRDLLDGSIRAVQDAHGSIINFIGDGLTAVLPSEEDAGIACMAIAHDLGKTRDYLVSNGSEVFPQLRVGVGLKIGVERGWMQVSSISSEFVGNVPYFFGKPAVYATRISRFGRGDRCLIGPKVAAKWPYGPLDGPFFRKRRTFTYEYYSFDLGEFWVD
jgi:class 3 adenylate cyclase